MKKFKSLQLILFFILMAGLSGCTGGAGGITASGTSSTSGTFSLSVTNVYPSAQAATFATPSAASRYYIKGLQASITGTCSRGIATIKVSESGPNYSETATCLNDGTFVWNKTYISAQEGNKTLTLTAYDVTDTLISGLSASVDVRIDATAPAAPGLVTPASTPYDYNGSASTFVIQVSGTSDTVRMTGPAAAELTFSSPNYEHTIALTAGSSSIYTFYAYDLAGNQSTGTDITIGYIPSVDLKIGGAFLGGPVTDNGTSFTAETTIYHTADRTTDAGTSFTVEAGFNFMTNQSRGDQ